MRKRILSAASAIALAAAMLPAVPGNVTAAEETVKIMPLGDSITYGMADEGGYRKYLWQFLKQKGYDNIDFVGPEGKDAATFSFNGQQVSYDDNHAGYSGYTITNLKGGWMGQLNGILETMQNGDFITKYKPDIILLQIGTNDINNGYLDGSEERLHQLLDYLRENMPADGTIFLTTIPDLGNSGWAGNSAETNKNIAKYNELIKKVADDYAANHVIYADIHSTIDASVDLADGVHPNAGGYEKMGKYWAEQIDVYLKSDTQSSQPKGTSATDFILGDVNADGIISAIDLSLLKHGVLSGSTDMDFLKRADVNQSGKVNALDASMLRDFLIGKIRKFEKGEPDSDSVTVIPTYEKSYNFSSVSSLKSNNAVPDPFVFWDGSKVESKEDWWKRQAEISCLYEYYMYGIWRDGSDDEVSYNINGSTMTITVKRKSTGKTASFKATISLPKTVRHEGGAPVILGMHKGISEETATANGYAVITYESDGMFSAPGTAADNNQHTGAFYDLYPYGKNWEEQTGELMAWSWGLSRILDALFDGAGQELNINPENSIVTGVSRYGKAAAVCGAFEKRIKMCAPSCSGAGGLALYRYKSEGKTYDFTSKGGSAKYTYDQNEPLGSLQASGEQGWFNGRFMEFKAENQIPVDQHMLASMCADPNRYLFIICSCEGENWVNAPSQWMTYLGAKHVFDYLGLNDHIAINVHLSGHAVIKEDMQYMMDYFDYHVYGLEPKSDLSSLTHSPFELPKNKDTFADTFAANWLY